MTLNYPGPYEVRMRTRVNGIEHVSKYNCFVTGSPPVGEPAGNINITQRNGVAITFAAAATNWYNLLKGLFNTTSEFFDFELWKYAANSFSATFVTATGAAGNGASATPATLAGQHILTFRTAEGGIMRLSLMEAIVAGYAVESPPYSTAAIQNIHLFVVGTTNWIIARDTSYPIVGLRWLQGQNEATFKDRYR
jgi:hypothetical protein